jgi:hypothetical protein
MHSDSWSPGPIVIGRGPFFPRSHPSRETLLVLGALAILGAGPLAGIPTIVLGRLVLREIDASRGQYLGRSSVLASVALGWAGTFIYSALAVAALTSKSPPTGGGLFGVGLAVALLTAALTAVPRLRAHRALIAPGVVAALVLVGGVTLGRGHRSAVEERTRLQAARACESDLTTGQRALAQNDFAGARHSAARARSACGVDSRARVQELGQAVDREQAIYTATLEKKQREEAEAREVDAEARFRAAIPELTRLLRATKASANAGRWENARDSLQLARSTLAGFADFRVAHTDDWRKLQARAEAERPRIATAVAALEQRRERDAETRRQREEAIEAAKERARSASSGGGTVLCCDGTRSPSCGCNRSSFRGCCSHHGGICGGCD